MIATRLLDFAGPADELARRLIGRRLVRIEPDGARLAGIIVETEAYLGPEDAASHTAGGRRTPRVETMYAAGGRLYVYRIYGLHHCANVVCDPEGHGAAVLLRAVEPVEGLDRMARRRPAARRAEALCAGPGRLAAAFDLDTDDDGRDLRDDPRLGIEAAGPPIDPARIAATPRIGIGSAGAWAAAPLRFVLAGSRFLSRSGTRRSGNESSSSRRATGMIGT